MDGMDRIHQLVEELNEALRNEFPEGDQLSITYFRSGRINISVTEFDDGIDKEADQLLRRDLWDQWFSDGKWETDRSNDQNKYYEEIGSLLKKEVKVHEEPLLLLSDDRKENRS